MSTSEIPVYSRRRELPLSYSELMMAQRALNDPSLRAHNGFLANLLIGPLDRDALTASLGELAQRQEILRTGFVLRDGRLIRAIGDAMPPPLDVIDLQSLDSDARDAEAQRRSEAEIRRAFDLTQRMMRATLFILAPERHVLVLTLHHAIADAWSLAIVAQELTRLYGQHAHGEPANLPPLRIQYADYAAWKHAQLQGDRLAELTARWTRRLQNPPPPLDLPSITDSRDGKQLVFKNSESLPSRHVTVADSEGESRTFPPDLPSIADSRDGKESVFQRVRGPSVPTNSESLPSRLGTAADSEGASRTFTLDAMLVEQVRRCSRRHRVTPFTTLLAAFAGMLALMTRQHDLVVVVPVSDRSSRDLQHLVGLFIDMMLVRLDCSGNPTFEQLLARVQQATQVLSPAEALPLPLLAGCLGPEAHRLRGLGQVVFNVVNWRNPAIALPGLTVAEWPVDVHEPVRNALTLNIRAFVDDPQRMDGILKYPRGRFSDDWIARVIEQVRGTLTQAVADPTRRLDEYSFDASLQNRIA